MENIFDIMRIAPFLIVIGTILLFVYTIIIKKNVINFLNISADLEFLLLNSNNKNEEIDIEKFEALKNLKAEIGSQIIFNILSFLLFISLLNIFYTFINNIHF